MIVGGSAIRSSELPRERLQAIVRMDDDQVTPPQLRRPCPLPFPVETGKCRGWDKNLS